MFSTRVLRLYGAAAVLLLVGVASASAQGTKAEAVPREYPATEKYRVEASAGFWSPNASMAIESEYLGIVGSNIDFKNDLGMTDHWFNELHFVGKLAHKHKFRFQYIPINYDQTATLTKDIVFRAQRYRVGLPVNSQLEWKAYRFSYEYDVLATSKAFGGVIVDLKYTDVKAGLQSPVLDEFIHARAPIPAIGGIGRYYVTPDVSVTGEFTYFTLPQGAFQDYRAHYADFEIYGTYNFTKNVGGQFGFRSFDLGYLVKSDVGDFSLRGVYFGIVARY